MPATLSLLENPERNADPKGTSDGLKYEVQLLLLFMVKATLQDVKFKVSSNVKGFGTFDDLVAECEFPDGSKKLICVQAKHKADTSKWCLDLNLLQGKRCVLIDGKIKTNVDNAFKVERYYDSIKKSKVLKAIRSEKYMDVEYVIYTNIKRDDSVNWICNTSQKSPDLIDSSNTVNNHNMNHIKNESILKNIDYNTRAEFLHRLVFLTNQKNSEQLQHEIIELHQKLLDIKDKEYVTMLFNYLFNEVKKCYEFLIPIKNEDYNTMLQVAKQEMCYIQIVQNIHDVSHDIEFDASITSSLRNQIDVSTQSLCVKTEDNSTLFTLIKVYQTLRHRDNFVFVDIKNLAKVLFLFEHKKDSIVVDCNHSSKDHEKYLKDVIQILKNHSTKKGIFIVKSENIPRCLLQSSKIDTKYCFNDFDAATQGLLLHKSVLFQGYEVNLKDLFDFCKMDCKLINNQMAERILKKEKYEIGTKLLGLDPNVEYCYIPRFFKPCILKTNALKDLKESDVFFLSTNDLTKLDITNFVSYPNIDVKNTNLILHKSKDVDTLPNEEYNEICIKLRNKGINATKNIHFITYKAEQIEWQFTDGEVNNLQNYVVMDSQNQSFAYSEDQLIKNSHLKKVNLIVDNAGMGKTTVLKKLAESFKQQHRLSWVEYFDLSSQIVTEQLAEMKVLKLINNLQAMEILINKFFSLKSSFDLELTKKIKIVIFFDGFDELNNEYADSFISFIQYLSQNDNIKIYIASRDNRRNKLEVSLCTLASNMIPFNDQNQIYFLEKFIKIDVISKKISTTDKNIETFATQLHASLVNINQCIRNIMGIPLLLKVLAVINICNFYAFLVSGSYDHLFTSFASLSEIYEECIKRKLERYLEEKEGLSKNHSKFQDRLQNITKSSNESHELLAVENLSKQSNITLSKKEKIKLQEIIEQKSYIEQYGIICSIDANQFLHLTFAEYFVAIYMVKKLNNIQNIRTQEDKKHIINNLGNILIANQCTMVRKFMEPLLDGIIGKIKLLLPEIKIYTTNVRTLHLAVLENNINICKLILNSIPSNVNIVFKVVRMIPKLYIDRKKFVNLRDSKGKTALDIASTMGHSSIVSLLISNDATVNITNDKNTSALINASKKGYADILSYLLDRGTNIADTDNTGCSALLYATKYGHIEIVTLLLDRGADVQEKNNNGESSLMYAAKNNHSNILSLLLSRGADIHDTDVNGFTSLMFAAMYGYAKVLSLLLDKGAKLTDKDYNGCSVTLHAAFNGDIEIMSLLLDRGVDIQQKNNNDETSLIIAAQRGHSNLVALLLKRGSNIEETEMNGSTSLMFAARHGHIEVVSLLLEQGAYGNYKDYLGNNALMGTFSHECIKMLLQYGVLINQRNENGNTALHHAVIKNNLNACKILLKNKAVVDIRNIFGNTALHEAAMQYNSGACKLLYDNGVDINIKNNVGDTALHIAARNVHMNACNCLVKCGAKINLQNDNGDTALHSATELSNVITVRFLLDNGADLRVRNKDGDTALDLASRLKNVDSFKTLLDYGANVNTKNKYGDTLLHIAALGNYIETFKLLLEHGADVKIQNQDGDTALHIAAVINNIEACKLLLNSGAEANIQNKNGDTALHIASRINKIEACKLLLENGADANIQNKDGDTVLHTAAFEKNNENVNFQ